MTIKLAVALHHSRDLHGAVDAAVAADRLGYDSVWMPEAYGSDAVSMLALARRPSNWLPGCSRCRRARRRTWP
jgi:alkanesulfonate monooxygenase SsuD/methylene tetrahydromethanopterin reductase-like flavin-dependent oxidoreductase (luciferase family)